MTVCQEIRSTSPNASKSHADLDVVWLPLRWHRPDVHTVQHPLKDMYCDLVFGAQEVGQGLDLEAERIKRAQYEEKKRNVLGKSTWRVASSVGGQC